MDSLGRVQSRGGEVKRLAGDVMESCQQSSMA